MNLKPLNLKQLLSLLTSWLTHFDRRYVGYQSAWFWKDLSAGLTVAVVALPLAMAFAIASGVPPQAGLVAAVVGGFFVSALGGSQVQIGGPAGAFIVVVYGIVERYGVAHLLLCTLFAGVLLFGLGCLKLGNLVRLVPVSVVIGFTNGIAVLIAVSQLKDFFGLHIAHMPGHFFEQLQALWLARSSLNFYAFGLATSALVLLFLWPKAFKSQALQGWRRALAYLPAPLVVLVVSTVVVSVWSFPVDTVGSRFGQLPQHLLTFAWPIGQGLELKNLFAPTLTLTVLGAIESLLCARIADARMTGLASPVRHDPNRELIGQGIANIASPLLGGLPVTGTIARTVTNIRSGARSPLAGMIHAVALFALVMLAAPLAERVPLAALAAILMFIAWNMGDWHEFSRLPLFSAPYRTLVLTTFVLTVVLDLTVAVEVGLVLACLFFIHRITALTQLEKQACALPGTALYTVFGSLFFASAAKLERLADDPSVRFLVLDLDKTINVDTTGVEALHLLWQQLQARGGELLLCNLNPQPLSLLQRSGFVDKLGQERVFASRAEALAYASAQIAA